LHGDILMWLMKTLLTSGCTNQRGAGQHYDTLARLRVVLSDREAWGYLSIGLLVSALFSMTIIRMSMESGINAGHIYSVMTYMWMFATSLDDAPQLLEKFSQLRDIGKRVSTDDETSLSGKPC
ncbi:ABC transporter six-transmembrane domain-containing protein, partial [Klebsiella pneumoniae]